MPTNCGSAASLCLPSIVAFRWACWGWCLTASCWFGACLSVLVISSHLWRWAFSGCRCWAHPPPGLPHSSLMASIHGCSPTVGLFTSPPSRAGWPSVSEVGVGVRVPNPGLMGGLESPPIRPRRQRRVHLPLKRGRKKTQRLALTFFVNGSHSSNRRWDRLRRASPPNQPWIRVRGKVAPA